MILIPMILAFVIAPANSFVPSVFTYDTYEMQLENTYQLACTLDLN